MLKTTDWGDGPLKEPLFGDTGKDILTNTLKKPTNTQHLFLVPTARSDPVKRAPLAALPAAPEQDPYVSADEDEPLQALLKSGESLLTRNGNKKTAIDGQWEAAFRSVNMLQPMPETALSLEEAVKLIQGEVTKHPLLSGRRLYTRNEWVNELVLEEGVLKHVLPWFPVEALLYSDRFSEWSALVPPPEYHFAWDEALADHNSPLWRIAYYHFAHRTIRPRNVAAMHLVLPSWRAQLLQYAESCTLMSLHHDTMRVTVPDQNAPGVVQFKVLRGPTTNGRADGLHIQLIYHPSSPDRKGLPNISISPVWRNLEEWFDRAVLQRPSLVEVLTLRTRYPQGLFLLLLGPSRQGQGSEPYDAMGIWRRAVDGRFDSRRYTPEEIYGLLLQMGGNGQKFDYRNLPPNVVTVHWMPSPEDIAAQERLISVTVNLNNKTDPNLMLQAQKEYPNLLRQVSGTLRSALYVHQSWHMYQTAMFPTVNVYLLPVDRLSSKTLPELTVEVAGATDTWKRYHIHYLQWIVRVRLFKARYAVPGRRLPEVLDKPEEALYRTLEINRSDTMPYAPEPSTYLTIRLVLRSLDDGQYELDRSARQAKDYRETSISDGASGFLAACLAGKANLEVHLHGALTGVLKGNGSGGVVINSTQKELGVSVYDQAQRVGAPPGAGTEGILPSAMHNFGASSTIGQGALLETSSSNMFQALFQTNEATGISSVLLGLHLENVKRMMHTGRWDPNTSILHLIDPDGILKRDFGIRNVVLMLYSVSANKVSLGLRMRFTIVENYTGACLLPTPFDEALHDQSTPMVALHSALVTTHEGKFNLPSNPNIAKSREKVVHYGNPHRKVTPPIETF